MVLNMEKLLSQGTALPIPVYLILPREILVVTNGVGWE